MRKPLTVAELEALAESSGVPAETLARWHVLHWRHEPHKNTGRRSGERQRPTDTLSVADVIRKHGIKAATLAAWRKQGLPHQRIGAMIVVNDADLARWMRERGMEKP